MYVLKRSLRAPKGKLREAYAKRQGVAASDLDPNSVEFDAVPTGWKFREAYPHDNLGKYLHPPGGKKSLAKKKQDKATIDVKFPDILAHDITSRINAIVAAATMGNSSGQFVGIDERTAVGLCLSELGVEDVATVLEAMYPQDDYDANRTAEEEPPAPVPPVPAPAAAEPPKPPEPAPPPTKAKESISQDPAVIERAVQQLIAAARRNLAERKARVA